MENAELFSTPDHNSGIKENGTLYRFGSKKTEAKIGVIVVQLPHHSTHGLRGAKSKMIERLISLCLLLKRLLKGRGGNIVCLLFASTPLLIQMQVFWLSLQAPAKTLASCGCGLFEFFFYTFSDLRYQIYAMFAWSTASVVEHRGEKRAAENKQEGGYEERATFHEGLEHFEILRVY